MKNQSNLQELSWKGVTLIPHPDANFIVQTPCPTIQIPDFPVVLSCQPIDSGTMYLSQRNFQFILNRCLEGDKTFNDFTIITEEVEETPDAASVLGDQQSTDGQ